MIGGPLDGATLMVRDIPTKVLIHADDGEVQYRLLALQPAEELAADRLHYVPDDSNAEVGGIAGLVTAVLDALTQFEHIQQHCDHDRPPPDE